MVNMFNYVWNSHLIRTISVERYHTLPSLLFEFYFGTCNRKWFVFTLASFTSVPRVDTEETTEEKEVSRIAETKQIGPNRRKWT